MRIRVSSIVLGLFVLAAAASAWSQPGPGTARFDFTTSAISVVIGDTLQVTVAITIPTTPDSLALTKVEALADDIMYPTALLDFVSWEMAATAPQTYSILHNDNPVTGEVTASIFQLDVPFWQGEAWTLTFVATGVGAGNIELRDTAGLDRHEIFGESPPFTAGYVFDPSPFNLDLGAPIALTVGSGGSGGCRGCGLGKMAAAKSSTWGAVKRLYDRE